MHLNCYTHFGSNGSKGSCIFLFLNQYKSGVILEEIHKGKASEKQVKSNRGPIHRDSKPIFLRMEANPF